MRLLWKVIGRLGAYVTWPLVYVTIKHTTRTRVLIIYNDEVLLLQGWLSTGRWMVPGGGLHPKEDPKIAAIREISEELHIVVEKTQLQPLGIFHQTKGHPYTFHGYAVVLDAKPVLKVRTSEINAARWVPVSKLSNLYTDQHVQLLLDTWRKQR